MMVSARSRLTLPPRPSQVSARPSSWKPPVIQTVAAIDRPTATGSGHSPAAPSSTAAPTAPTHSPTSG